MGGQRGAGKITPDGDAAGIKRRTKPGLGGMADGLPRGLHEAGLMWPPEPENVPRVAHGVKNRVNRLKALGNAVIPQIPEMIGRAIMAVGT